MKAPSSVIAWMQHQSGKDSYTIKLYIIWVLEFAHRMLSLNDTRSFCGFIPYHLEDAKAFSVGKTSIFYVQLSVHFDGIFEAAKLM